MQIKIFFIIDICMTEKLFLKDSYLKECDAIVTSAEGNKIELNQTIFYAQSGGQPSDRGTILRKKDNASFAVKLAKNDAGRVWHELDIAGISLGDEVKCWIDWDLRYKHMRMHTSAHILAAIVHQETGTLITGNQLGTEESRMDFSVKDFDRSFLTSIQDKANEIVKQNLLITISFESRENALLRPELFRLKDVLPKDIPEFRILSIGSFDVQADGGTHVHSTKEVGKITITDLKNKGAENRRVYWKLE
jgi:misacylated tRNA(Ala) deacylase